MRQLPGTFSNQLFPLLSESTPHTACVSVGQTDRQTDRQNGSQCIMAEVPCFSISRESITRLKIFINNI